MSGIFFRVFENLISDENDPARFKLDIMVNNGSLLHPDKIKDIQDHCIPISLNDTFQKTLTLEDINHFFVTLLNMQNGPEPNDIDSQTSGNDLQVPHIGVTKKESNQSIKDEFFT